MPWKANHGLLAWLEAACDWELNGRVGLRYELQPPEAAIPPKEDAVSIDAAIVLRDTFTKELPAVRALFDALAALSPAAGRSTRSRLARIPLLARQ
jgi:hypothetical protein